VYSGDDLYNFADIPLLSSLNSFNDVR
jgi:hypothetical protein